MKNYLAHIEGLYFHKNHKYFLIRQHFKASKINSYKIKSKDFIIFFTDNKYLDIKLYRIIYINIAELKNWWDGHT